jgi:hypothetical protein
LGNIPKSRELASGPISQGIISLDVAGALALEGALMTRERWMLWMLGGLSTVLGILLFFFG